MKDLSVNFPDDILDRFLIEGIIVSPYINTTGWAFLSENDNNSIILRIFLIEKERESLAFELKCELSAFIFPTKIEMKNFYKHLLNMSALEYMIIMNDNTAINLH